MLRKKSKILPSHTTVWDFDELFYYAFKTAFQVEIRKPFTSFLSYGKYFFLILKKNIWFVEDWFDSATGEFFMASNRPKEYFGT